MQYRGELVKSRDLCEIGEGAVTILLPRSFCDFQAELVIIGIIITLFLNPHNVSFMHNVIQPSGLATRSIPMGKLKFDVFKILDIIT